MTFIKMCGLQDEATVDLAVELGVDAVGFVLVKSPRRISPSGPRRSAPVCRREHSPSASM